MLDPMSAAMVVQLHQRELLEQAEQARQVTEIRRARPRSAAWRLFLRRRSGAAGRATAMTTA